MHLCSIKTIWGAVNAAVNDEATDNTATIS